MRLRQFYSHLIILVQPTFVGNTTITMTANAIIDYDDISAFFDSVRNVFSNFSARHTQEAYQHRQQLADNATETTEGETLADSRGSDDVVSDTLSSARDSRKRKNSNEGSDGSDDDERRDGGSAAEKRVRSIPTTASATTSNANESSESNGREGHAIVLHNIGNGVESSSNNKENNATLRRGGIGEKGEIKKHYHLAICFQQTILFSSNLFSTNLTQTFVPLLYHLHIQHRQ